MAQLWGGRFTKETDKLVYNFNASISFDQKFYKQDIRGSKAHVRMLAKQGILTEEEKEKFTKQLGDVLKHVDAMNEVDTSNVEPMAHAIDFVNVMREDEVYYEQTKEELMKNAPDEENGFFRVPKIN